MNEYRMDDPFPPTPEGFHLRVMKTLDRLEEEPMKRRHKVGTVALVAAIILAFAFGAALAAGYFSGEIDWSGRRVSEDAPDEPEPEPTETPTEAIDTEARETRKDKIFAAQPDGEYWIIENDDGTANARDCRKTFDSLETLNEFLKAGATDFRLVTEAPEGYAFVGGVLHVLLHEGDRGRRKCDAGRHRGRYDARSRQVWRRLPAPCCFLLC